MKKLVLFISLALLSTSTFSQTENTIFNLHPKTGEIYYSEVIKVESKSKDNLFINANSWFTDTFISSKDVVQYSDKDKGVIIGKGTFDAKNGVVNFTAKINVKEGKYRYELYSFKYVPSGKIKTHGDLRKEKPGGGMSAMWRSHWRKARTQTMNNINNLILSLNAGMKNSTTLANDDW